MIKRLIFLNIKELATQSDSKCIAPQRTWKAPKPWLGIDFVQAQNALRLLFQLEQFRHNLRKNDVALLLAHTPRQIAA